MLLGTTTVKSHGRLFKQVAESQKNEGRRQASHARMFALLTCVRREAVSGNTICPPEWTLEEGRLLSPFYGRQTSLVNILARETVALVTPDSRAYARVRFSLVKLRS